MTKRLLVVILGLVLAGFGCSDDDSTGDASVNNDAAGTSDVQVADAPPPKLSGTVVQYAEGDPTPVEGARVSVLDADPVIEATSGVDGAFELDPPPDSSGVVFLLVEKAGLIGGLRGIIALSGGLSGIELGLLTPAVADSIIDDLSFPDRDVEKGIVAVEFSSDSGAATGGEKAEIEATHDGSFVIAADGNPQSGDTLVEGGDTSVIFVNVATGTTTASVTAEGCNPVLGSAQAYPVRADTMTMVDVTCP